MPIKKYVFPDTNDLKESEMSGSWITVKQEELYMKARRLGDTQIISSAKAGISERSGRKIEKGQRKDPRKMERWRSCPDPLSGVWDKDLRPLLERHLL